MPIQYQEVPLDDVMRFYADGFDRDRLAKVPDPISWFVDPSRGVVVFKFCTTDNSPVERIDRSKMPAEPQDARRVPYKSPTGRTSRESKK